MSKVCVFIDGGNFYHLVLKRLDLHELDLDFERFVGFLADQRQIADKGKRFYVGTVRQKKNNHESDAAMKNQTRLFTELWKTGWVIQTSKLRTRRERIVIDDRVEEHERITRLGIKEIVYERSREKGIDVKIATDLIAGAVDDKYTTAIIVSSDTDLVPAIDWVRKRKGIVVEYVGFSFPEVKDARGNLMLEELKPANKMIYNSDVQRVLTEHDIRKFLKETLFTKAAA